MDVALGSVKGSQTSSNWWTPLLWVCAVALASVIALAIPRDVGVVALLAWTIAVWLLALARPRLGLYLLLFGTMFVEQDVPPGGVPLFNAQIPFFWDSSGFTSLRLPITPCELLLAATVVGWIVHGLRTRRGLGLRQHRLLGQTALFGLTLLLGTAHGLLTGGDLKEALWEIRGLSYAVVMVLLIPGLVRRRRHLDTVVWIIILGVIFTSLEGLWVAAIDLNWNVNRVDTIVGHDDAAHIAGGLALLVSMLVIGGDRWQKLILLIGSPVMVYVLFATRRRDAFIALGLGLIVLAVMRMRERPADAWRFLAGAMVALTVYGALYLVSGESQVLGQPIRAVTSAIAPSTARDIASNRYRHFERLGLRQTIKDSPVFGVGFGKKYDVPPQVFYIGFPHYQYITHDDILRIWAKVGAIGFLLYWVFAGGAIVEGSLVFRRLHDGRLKALAAFAVCFVAMQLTIHSVDMATTYYRSMILFGTVIGLMLSLNSIQIPLAKSPRASPHPQPLSHKGRGEHAISGTVPPSPAHWERGRG